jgi:hypothetical protein
MGCSSTPQTIANASGGFYLLACIEHILKNMDKNGHDSSLDHVYFKHRRDSERGSEKPVATQSRRSQRPRFDSLTEEETKHRITFQREERMRYLECGYVAGFVGVVFFRLVL